MTISLRKWYSNLCGEEVACGFFAFVVFNDLTDYPVNNSKGTQRAGPACRLRRAAPV